MSDSYPDAVTHLDIAEFGVQPYSARGLTQSLEPIAASQQLRRTVNGDLIDVSAPQFRKFSSTITGSDQLPPVLDGIFPGQQLIVDCIPELQYRTAGGTPSRTVVPGSSRTEGDFTLYRPRLLMRVVTYSWQRDEWAASVPWSLQLEEV